MESGDVHKRRDNVMPLPSASGRETAVPTDERRLRAPGSRSQADVHPLLDPPHPESIERALFEPFEPVAERSDSVALIDVRIDGQLDLVLEIQSAREPGPAGLERVGSPA